VTHTLAPYLGSDNYINIYYSPHITLQVYTYVQVSFNGKVANLTAYSNMNSLFFDPNGTYYWGYFRLLHAEGPTYSTAQGSIHR